MEIYVLVVLCVFLLGGTVSLFGENKSTLEITIAFVLWVANIIAVVFQSMAL